MYDEIGSVADVDGLFTRKQALSLGWTDRTLARAVRAKVIHRVRHGSYVLSQTWDPLTERERHVLTSRAVLRASRTESALSHTSAAVLLRAPVWDLSLDEVHLTRIDHRGGRREAGVVQHRGRVHPDDISERARLLVTSPTRTAVDLTTITDVEHSLCVMDHFLHTGQTSKDLLAKGSDAMRLWANTLTTDLVIGLADGRRESVGESRSFHMMWRSGIPLPTPQVDIVDADGVVVARVDCAWPGLKVWLEFDGKEKYEKYRREGESVLDAVRREKRREEMISRITGWRCIRIVWADLYRPEATVAMIASVLAGGPVYA